MVSNPDEIIQEKAMPNIEVAEPNWAKALSSAPVWLTSILLAFPGLPAAFLSNTEAGMQRNLCIAVIIVPFLVAASLLLMRHFREKSVEEVQGAALAAAIEKDQKAYKELIEEMSTSVYHLASVLGVTLKPERDKEFSVVRTSVLEMVRHLLGAQSGVQANLFTVYRVNPPLLKAAKWGSAGGKNGQTSEREFTPGDTTFDLAMNKLSRYVADVSELQPGESPSRTYQTFATHPVASDDDLYGILTIDAPCANDISELDVELLAFFAGILSATFIAEKESKSIPRR